MNAQELLISQEDIRKLLGAASPDAAILYIYLRSGNDPSQAAAGLHLPQPRVDCAMATLRQLGLWQTERKTVIQGEAPNYTEEDVMAAHDDRDFRQIYGEIQHQLGRPLNTEEMKIVLRMIRYLGLPPEVVFMLVNYCRMRAKQKGSLRNPSLRTIEKEAHLWADMGIDTMEEASAYINRQTQRNSQLGQLMQTLQIRDRSLTESEVKYAQSWFDMGFQLDAIAIAYDLACVHAGGRSWPYMNKILIRWHESGIHTAQQVKAQRSKETALKGASGQLGAAELANIQKLLQEEK